MSEEKVLAVVRDVVHGKHGYYAVATTESKAIKGSITFSLSKLCWREKDRPEPGTSVVLTGLRKKRAGWRATRARFARLFEVT